MTDPPSGGAKPRARSSSRSSARTDAAPEVPPLEALTYREAQAALEQSLVELQADDLDVERMTEVYQRARAYADRCDTLLQSVEAQVLLWDPDQPDRPPQPQSS
jgi:exodeoxyribonuclease VII small subunit